MPHAPAHHLINNTFVDENTGLTPQVRNQGGIAANVCASPEMLAAIVVDPYALSLRNPDRSDPPRYMPGDVPRSATFNGNVVNITGAARMPEIALEVECANFTPSAANPLHWRLQCHHQFCRHNNVGNYRYEGRCEAVTGEWQGTASSNAFRLFGTTADPAVTYTHNAADMSPVGGHAILTIAAKPPGEANYLLDYVHMQVRGSNPTLREAEVNGMCAGRPPQIATIVYLCFEHESGFEQFETGIQARVRMRFRAVHHNNDPTQPTCSVFFDFPDDPPGFPKEIFDFGVGISQYTILRARTLEAAIAWDWKANMTIGMNLLMAAARRVAAANPGMTWRDLAWQTWRRYNGAGPQAIAYANQLAADPRAATIPNAPIPAGVAADLAAFPSTPAQAPAPAWPPP